jgi:hypothetical protein
MTRSDPFLEIPEGTVDTSIRDDYLNPSVSVADDIFAQGPDRAITFAQLPTFARPSARMLDRAKGCIVECPYTGCGGIVIFAYEDVHLDVCLCPQCESVFKILCDVPESALLPLNPNME